MKLYLLAFLFLLTNVPVKQKEAYQKAAEKYNQLQNFYQEYQIELEEIYIEKPDTLEKVLKMMAQAKKKFDSLGVEIEELSPEDGLENPNEDLEQMTASVEGGFMTKGMLDEGEIPKYKFGEQLGAWCRNLRNKLMRVEDQTPIYTKAFEDELKKNFNLDDPVNQHIWNNLSIELAKQTEKTTRAQIASELAEALKPMTVASYWEDLYEEKREIRNAYPKRKEDVTKHLSMPEDVLAALNLGSIEDKEDDLHPDNLEAEKAYRDTLDGILRDWEQNLTNDITKATSGKLYNIVDQKLLDKNKNEVTLERIKDKEPSGDNTINQDAPNLKVLQKFKAELIEKTISIFDGRDTVFVEEFRNKAIDLLDAPSTGSEIYNGLLEIIKADKKLLQLPTGFGGWFSKAITLSGEQGFMKAYDSWKSKALNIGAGLRKHIHAKGYLTSYYLLDPNKIAKVLSTKTYFGREDTTIKVVPGQIFIDNLEKLLPAKPVSAADLSTEHWNTLMHGICSIKNYSSFYKKHIEANSKISRTELEKFISTFAIDTLPKVDDIITEIAEKCRYISPTPEPTPEPTPTPPDLSAVVILGPVEEDSYQNHLIRLENSLSELVFEYSFNYATGFKGTYEYKKNIPIGIYTATLINSDMKEEVDKKEVNVNVAASSFVCEISTKKKNDGNDSFEIVLPFDPYTLEVTTSLGNTFNYSDVQESQHNDIKQYDIFDRRIGHEVPPCSFRVKFIGKDPNDFVWSKKWVKTSEKLSTIFWTVNRVLSGILKVHGVLENAWLTTTGNDEIDTKKVRGLKEFKIGLDVPGKSYTLETVLKIIDVAASA
jgi:hypothetical protein